MSAEAPTHPFASLGPDTLLGAVEAVGLEPDGRLLALNSYENRVYQIGLEEAAPVVVKFYRPRRWSEDGLREEHAFAEELVGHDIPVVPPLRLQGETLHRHDGFHFAVYPRRGGRPPELDDPDTLEWLGRFLGRIHAVGEVRGFVHRRAIDVAGMGQGSRDYLLASGWIPAYLEPAYASVTRDLLEAVEAAWQRAGAFQQLRLHGDCHPGNILWTDAGPHFVDLDDCATGPAVQDLWMLLSGEREERTVQLSDLIAGYEDFHDFDRRELHLVEPLRTLRIMHYAAWLARRWDDPAFPTAFPWFGTDRYWEEHLLALREQAAALQEPPLVV
ncbi:serine/threonine protein kinase [Sediminicurvatus halobius]|uniref:Stress response kinase A n=1 Tax=Sediminicurvatus halobius TaxID=2182432 RepID=A0A2U2N7F1_9GAMM|nr:serine/threonine protein kinase [Spiribacter halobius]PWG65101.1 serine/threonine protein kinase [Spiribacter halobius]UEX78951.1 serine/threonine protein kinase [Spiribacter halobius]